MQDHRASLILTRPAAQSARFAQLFAARFGDWPVVVSPLLRILPCDADIPAADALIFTSAAGVEGFVRLQGAAGRRAFCVGEQTALAAQKAGFVAEHSGGDVEALFAALLTAKPVGKLLHARGEVSVGDLANRLVLAGIETVERVVYAQEPQDLSPQAQVLLQRQTPLLVPLFSPRTAEIFALQATGAIAPLLFAPISAKAARPVQGLGLVEVAPEPNAEGVLQALERQIARLALQAR